MKVTNFSDDYSNVLAGGPTTASSAAIHNTPLNDLLDVTAPSPADGDAVTWNGSEWVPVHALTEADVVAIITPVIYFCDSIAIEASKGTLDAGAHTDLHGVGGTTVHVSETGTTPGFELRAAFSAVDGMSNIYVHGYYTGNHTATVDLYNYYTTSWDTIATFATGASGFELLNAAIPDSEPYRDGSDNALVRFMHAGAGNPTHDLYLDYLAISFGGASAGPLALDDLTDVNAGAPDDGDVLTWDDGAAEWIAAPPGGGSPAHAAYTYFAASLEPLAIEELQRATYSYAVSGSATKLVVNAWDTRLGSSGRWEIRDPRHPLMPLRGVTVTGLSSTSTGVFIDPTLATYADAWDTYHDRLNAIYTTAPKYLSVPAPLTQYLFLPGPYGNIITSINCYDFAWIIARLRATASPTDFGWNLGDEIGDAAGDYQRLAHPTLIPVSRYVANMIETGNERTGGVGEGSITYLICPSGWGAVTDPNSYEFRDDFMGTAIDTGSTWNRTESTTGNLEIDTDFAWCKARGTTTWGQNGMFSQATFTRTTGKVFECWVYTGDIDANHAPGMYGWHDGAGYSYTDLVHAVNFEGNGTIDIYEAGSQVSANVANFTAKTVYRLKLVLASTGCTYYIQGGEHAPLGGTSWTTLYTSSSGTTTPMAVGMSVYGSSTAYWGDPKVY